MAIDDVQAKIAQANDTATELVEAVQGQVGTALNTNSTLDLARTKVKEFKASAGSLVPVPYAGDSPFALVPSAPAPTIMSDFEKGVFYKGAGSTKTIMSREEMWQPHNQGESYAPDAAGIVRQHSGLEVPVHYPWGAGGANGIRTNGYCRSLVSHAPDISSQMWSLDGNRGVVTTDTNVPAQIEGHYLTRIREDTGSHYRGLRTAIDVSEARTYLSVGFTVDFRHEDRGLRVYVLGWGDASLGGGFVIHLNDVDKPLHSSLIKYKATYLGGTRFRIEFSLGVPSTGGNTPTVFFRMHSVSEETVSYAGDGSSSVWLGDVSIVPGFLEAHNVYNMDGLSYTLAEVYTHYFSPDDIGNQDVITLYAEGEQNSNNGCFVYLYGNSGLSEHVRFGPVTNNSRSMYAQFLDMSGPVSIATNSFVVNPRHSFCKMMVSITRGGQIRVAMNGIAVHSVLVGGSYVFNRLRLGGIAPNNNPLVGTLKKFMLWGAWAPTDEEMLTFTEL